jgi:hypothetical protein
MSGWRPIERFFVDYFHRRGRHGCALRDVGGRPFLAVEVFDETTGELLETRYIADLETLARELAFGLAGKGGES